MTHDRSSRIALCNSIVFTNKNVIFPSIALKKNMESGESQHSTLFCPVALPRISEIG
jgi:hypothetical protein